MEFSESIIGKVIGNYEIQRELGRGGMGYVYKAHEQSLQRVVALKVLPPHLASSPQFVKRFEREARSAARLSHPNIVTVFAVGSEGDYHFIAMEYVKGATVDQIVRERGKMAPREAVEVIQQVADALAEAHRNDIIHRDIKPQNIMIDQAGRVKVMDFGLAKVMSGGSELTSAGTYLGTPTYMSPEQCQGKDLDSRTDIYSLGIMFYEMLTGTLPFTADTPLAVMRKIIDEPMPALNRTVAGLPGDLEYIIEKMAAKNPGARYASAEDLSADLKAWLRGDRTSVASEGETTIPSARNIRPPEPRPDATIVTGAKALSDPAGPAIDRNSQTAAVTSDILAETLPAETHETPRAKGGLAALAVATATFLVLVGIFGGAVFFLYGRSDSGGAAPSAPAPAEVAPTPPPAEAIPADPQPEPGPDPLPPDVMLGEPTTVEPAAPAESETVDVAAVDAAEAAAAEAKTAFAERIEEVDADGLTGADNAFEDGRAHRRLGNLPEALAAFQSAAEQYGALRDALPPMTAEPESDTEQESATEPAMAVRRPAPADEAPAAEADEPAPAEPEPAAEEMARETPPPAPKPAPVEAAAPTPAPKPAPTEAAAAPKPVAAPAPQPAPAMTPSTGTNATATAPPPAPAPQPQPTPEPEPEPEPAEAPPASEEPPAMEEPAPAADEPKAPRKRPAAPRHLRP